MFILLKKVLGLNNCAFFIETVNSYTQFFACCIEYTLKYFRLFLQLASHESSSAEEKNNVEEALHGISGCFATISAEISQLGIENTHQNTFQFEPLLREYSEKLIKAVQENKNFETT